MKLNSNHNDDSSVANPSPMVIVLTLGLLLSFLVGIVTYFFLTIDDSGRDFETVAVVEVITPEDEKLYDVESKEFELSGNAIRINHTAARMINGPMEIKISLVQDNKIVHSLTSTVLRTSTLIEPTDAMPLTGKFKIEASLTNAQGQILVREAK